MLLEWPHSIALHVLINMSAGTIATFQPFSPLAAALVAPTQLWVTIAAKLNYDIVQLNKQKP